MSSMNWTFGSMTHTSGKARSEIAPYVRDIRPTKIPSCCVISSEANVSPMTMPRYFARSPTSIFSATKFIGVGRYQGQDQTLTYNSAQTATSDEIRAADEALYASKRAGKNRLVVLDEAVKPPHSDAGADPEADPDVDEHPPTQPLGPARSGDARRARLSERPRSQPTPVREPSSTGSGGITLR